MNFTRHAHRLGAFLIALGALMAGLAGIGPAAFATTDPPGGGSGDVTAPSAVHTVTRTVVVGGMPGWQIALIAIAASVVTAAAVVLIDRARAGRLAPAHQLAAP